MFFNPKIIVFFLAVFSQFLSRGSVDAYASRRGSSSWGARAVWYALVAPLVSTGQVARRLRDYAGQTDIGFGVMLRHLAVMNKLWPLFA